METPLPVSIPLFGARNLARRLVADLQEARQKRDQLQADLERLGALTVIDLEKKKASLEQEVAAQRATFERDKGGLSLEMAALRLQMEELRKSLVATEDLALLQEVGVYHYQHPLTDVVAYEKELAAIEAQIKEMTKKDGGAVLAATSWSVNGSTTDGKKMVRDVSKLMLRAFNAEADNLIRTLKPFKLSGSIDRLRKVAQTIEKLGVTMGIQIAPPYVRLRIRELELTADYLQKVEEQKEAERVEKERLREERKVQQEIERERAKLEKERQHYLNAIAALEAKGDTEALDRLKTELNDIQKAIDDVDYRAANIRAGYVYVISNIGSFGDRMVKIGMTRRIDPLDRIRELSDASVPFNFDIHALFFSKDAVGIETALHSQLAAVRVNSVNLRREFFRARPLDVKTLLAELAGDLLEFHDVPEALEYRQCLASAPVTSGTMTSQLDGAPDTI